MTVPDLRVRARNTSPLRAERPWVVYWMIGNRRLRFNFALDRAIEHARALKKPLVILEPLRIGYRWANHRHHAFVLQGMADHARTCAARGVAYHPYVEPEDGAGRGLLAAFAASAAVVVTDWVPGFFLPRMVDKAASVLDVRLEDVDSNGLLPLLCTEAVFPTAYAFRRFLQRTLPDHLSQGPVADPLAGAARLPAPDLAALNARFPRASDALLRADVDALRALAIDASVAPVALHGGDSAGRAHMDLFLEKKLARYAEERSDPDADVQSGLSPWLHFGHLSVHEVFAALTAREPLSPDRAFAVKNGSRMGFYGLSAAAESFLDELVTWRELGFHFAAKQPAYDQYDSLPAWAQKSLGEHAGDARTHHYSFDDLDNARTHDAIWNAAQRQLRREGFIHNYLRMLWGKKVLEWSATPHEAFNTLVELNNRYALDGRDPNSYSGIAWCFGRYDRPWGPVRPIFGVIRYMSSDNTKRKLNLDLYLARYAEPGPAAFALSAAPAKARARAR